MRKLVLRQESKFIAYDAVNDGAEKGAAGITRPILLVRLWSIYKRPYRKQY